MPNDKRGCLEVSTIASDIDIPELIVTIDGFKSKKVQTNSWIILFFLAGNRQVVAKSKWLEHQTKVPEAHSFSALKNANRIPALS